MEARILVLQEADRQPASFSNPCAEALPPPLGREMGGFRKLGGDLAVAGGGKSVAR